MRIIISKTLALVFLLFLVLPINAEITCRIKGQVLDAETGEPVKGTLVFLRDGRDGYYKSYTDEEGKFDFPLVHAGDCGIGYFPPPPYAFAIEDNELEQLILEEGKVVYIVKKLVVGGVLDLTLRDATTNTPLKGIDVNVMKARVGLFDPSFKRHSDENGKYRMPQLVEGKYRLILIADGWGMKVIDDVAIRLKETTALTISYNPPEAASLSGTVCCEQTGELLTDIFVGIERVNGYGWAFAYTNDKGQYVFKDVEPGYYEVYVIGLKDKIDDEEHSVYIKNYVTITKGMNYIENFSVDCNLYFQKKWEYSWNKYKKQ